MLAAGENVRAQILKVGHHGSSTSSSPAFLAAVRPEVAIYSCGAGNSYGFPNPQTLAHLRAVVATVYGTDVNGPVIVTTDGNTYQVKPSKGGSGTTSSTTTSTSNTTTSTISTTTSTTSPPQTTTTLASLSITVESLTSPITRGPTASLTIKTTPGAQCTITVNYKSGPSSAAGLDPKTAGADGRVTWSWKVGSSTAPGIWSIVVTGQAGGHTTSLTIPFEVTS